MTLENAVRVLAETMIFISMALTLWVHPNFYWITLFIGANLIQSAFTGFYPATNVLSKLGFTSKS